MGLTQGDEYLARAEECNQRAMNARDDTLKLEWLRLAKSWEILAEGAKKTYKIVPPTSQ
jgi:hypothetical protein